MPPEEIREHRARREQIADDDAPPGQLDHHVRPEKQHDRDEEDLEGDEKNYQREQQRRFGLARFEQQSAGDSEGDERAEVE